MNSAEIERQHYEAIRQHVALLRFGPRTVIEARGNDRATFLHNLCTNDIRKLQPAAGCEAFFTNVQGKVLGHVFVFCHPHVLAIHTVPGQAETLMPHLDRYLIREDVTLTDRSGEWEQLLLVGPRAADLLQQLQLAAPTSMLSHVTAELGGITAQVHRVPFLAEDCFLVQVSSADLENVVQLTLSAGATEISADVWDIRRIESGFPLYGRDISADNLPQEVARDAHAISFTKGCYLGQETVARIDAVGHVNRYLVGLKFEPNVVPRVGLELQRQGRPMGQVTSVCMSPRLGSALALGYVRREAAMPGDELSSSVGTATVIELPV